MEDNTKIDMNEWYTASAAAARLSANSGKVIKASYPRKLAEYKKVTCYKLSDRNTLYLKADIDAYVVEDRGEKSGRASRVKAAPRKAAKAAAKQAKKKTA